MTDDLYRRNQESLRQRWARGYRCRLDLELAWKRIRELKSELDAARHGGQHQMFPKYAKEGGTSDDR